jgi:hypothetical protein
MNIFKILQGGHGSISETNITAFLSYLLNPNKDHGLNDELLKRILSVFKENDHISESGLVDRKNDIRNLSINSNFVIEVFPEQAFYSEIDDGEIIEKKKQVKKKIIDIVILFFEKKKENTQNLATALLSNSQRGELTHICFIENKINDNSTNQDQLNKEINFIIRTLKNKGKSEEDIKKIISLIFITPLGKKSSKEFMELKKTGGNYSISHLHWNSKDKNEKTISSILENILNDEATGKIDAINEYTKHTLKSFRNFIENGFKSDIIEDLGKEQFDELEKLKNAYPSLVPSHSWSMLEEFDKYLQENYSDISQRYYPSEPISVYKSNDHNRGTKIFGFVQNNSHLSIYLIFRNFQKLKLSQEKMKEFLRENNFNFKENTGKTKNIRVIRQSLNIEDSKKIFAELYQKFI